MEPSAAGYYQATEVGSLARDLHNVRVLRRQDGRDRTQQLDHHLCHASSAFFQSPFDRALIVTLDEDGDGDSGMIAIGQANKIKVLQRIGFPNSVARLYSQVTSMIGFAPRGEEQKTQWLSLEGVPEFKAIFLKMLRRTHGFIPWVDRSVVRGDLGSRRNFSSAFYKQTGLPTEPLQLSESQRRNLGSSIQTACAEVVCDLVEHLCDRHNIQHVCLSGGLFQNVLLVAAVEKHLGMDRVFVPPAPGNAGTAVGAVLLSWHQRLGQPRNRSVPHVYWGPRFSGQQAKDVLDNSKSRYVFQNTEERKLDTVIKLLTAGKIVGWVQGACEFGPRALGNRSVLASPWCPYVRENLNDFIKFREWFRPFAISVPEGDCHRYFYCSQLCRFMNSLGWVNSTHTCLPDGFLLPGGRVRLHVVERSVNPLFWQLLKRFGEQAPAPMLVNTSFNLFGDPLVVSPRDAIRSYYGSGIDALVMDNFVLSKTGDPNVLHHVAAGHVGACP